MSGWTRGQNLARVLLHRPGERPTNHFSREESVMGNRLFWAMLWVIGLPLPLVVLLYMLFGHS
jgi:hypothetical protein